MSGRRTLGQATSAVLVYTGWFFFNILWSIGMLIVLLGENSATTFERLSALLSLAGALLMMKFAIRWTKEEIKRYADSN